MKKTIDLGQCHGYSEDAQKFNFCQYQFWGSYYFMNKIIRLVALAAVVGTAVLSYSLPQNTKATSNSSFTAVPWPQSSK